MIIKLKLIEDKVKSIGLTVSGKGFLVFLWRWYSRKLTFREFIIPYCLIDVKKWKIKSIKLHE